MCITAYTCELIELSTKLVLKYVVDLSFFRLNKRTNNNMASNNDRRLPDGPVCNVARELQREFLMARARSVVVNSITITLNNIPASAADRNPTTEVIPEYTNKLY